MRYNVLAHRFDPAKLELIGDPITLAENVEYVPGYFRGVFSASDSGTLVFARAGHQRKEQLAVYDRSGKILSKLGDPAEFGLIRFSPDGQKVAASIGDPSDIWIYEVERGVRTRLTSHGLGENWPTWSPDGRRIFYSSDRRTLEDIFEMATDGAGVEKPVLETDDVEVPTDMSMDGRYLALDHAGSRTTSQADVWILPLDGDRKPYPFLATEFEEKDADFSPDGRWILYGSNESGAYECYASPFPSGEGRFRISTTGIGSACWWGNDGKEVLYLGQDDTVMSSAVVTRPSFRAETPRPLFKLLNVVSIHGTQDGQRFAAVVREEPAGTSPISFVSDWRPPAGDPR